MKQKLAFALIMGMISTAIISFVIIAIKLGFGERFITAWLRSWSVSYLLAGSSMLLIAPKIRVFLNALFNRNASVEEEE